MGEIDTKPIESVPTALSFFGHNKHSPSKDQEVEKDRELESLEKELANLRVRLEAKDSAYKQAILQLDHHKRTADELSTLLISSDFQKEFYINECQEAKARTDELESAINQMSRKLADSQKVEKHLSYVTSELQAARERLLNTEKERVILQEEKVEALSKAEAITSALSEEKLRTEELLRQVSETNGAIERLKTKALEIEREKTDLLSEKEAELESVEEALSEAEKQLEITMKQLEIMPDLENQLLEMSVHINSLQLELSQANEHRISSDKSKSDAITELNKLKEDIQSQEQKNMDKANYIDLLETDLKQLRTELGNANAEVSRLNGDVEKTKSELEKILDKENKAQVEIALLKLEVHKEKSKLAQAEAAESRAQSEKSALYNALQQMGLDVEETKKEKFALNEALKSAEDSKISSLEKDHEGSDHQAKETEEKHDKALLVNRNPEDKNGNEMENMKKELELAKSKIGELRTRAEQAISRAEAAEKARAVLEEQTGKRKEHKEQRRAAMAALQEEYVSRGQGSGTTSGNNIGYEINANKNYKPLGKMLNIKF